MARTAEPNSAGGQWFFVTDPPATPDPTGTYVVFGTITEGLDVAQAIRELGGDEARRRARSRWSPSRSRRRDGGELAVNRRRR